MPYDFVVVRPDPYFELQKKVNISGAVYYPGDYVIINSDDIVNDIIKRAGGLKVNAYPEASKFIRDGNIISINLNKIIKRASSSENIKVYNGDKIVIALNQILLVF